MAGLLSVAGVAIDVATTPDRAVDLPPAVTWACGSVRVSCSAGAEEYTGAPGVSYRLELSASRPRLLGVGDLRALDRFIFARLLAERGRAVVHAAAIARDGVGLLCGGESGAGKTTLARLADARGLEVLTDERAVVGLDDGDEPAVWGTPWHGEGGHARPGPARLARLLFLRKSERNELRPLSPASAAARVIALSTVPYWSREATAAVVEGAGRLAERVPAAELCFTPGAASVDFLEGLLRS